MNSGMADRLQRANDPNRHIWPEIHAYIFAAPCRRCHGPIGSECIAPQRHAAREREFTRFPERRNDPKWLEHYRIFHAPRIDKGIAHYDRDLVAAPPEEAREPGRCYCTIDPCPLVSPEARVAAAARWARLALERGRIVQ